VSKGIVLGLSKVREEISKRDEDDSKRAIAPLIVPEGAIIVDTTGIDPEGVINILMKFVMERL
jgi:cytidylate kinase